MKQFKTVFLFEYMGYIKNKTFQIVTVIILALILIGSLIPQIAVIIEAVSGGGVQKKAGFALGENAAGTIAAETLTEALPSYSWEYIDIVPKDGFETLLTDKTYNLVFFYNGGDTYDIYTMGRSIADYVSVSVLDTVVGNVHGEELIKDLGPDAKTAASLIKNMKITANNIQVSGDFMQSYWLSYILEIVLFMSIIMYIQLIMTSVVTEKTSKAMELLVSSAKPESLMFGKVVGVGSAALTQLLVIITVTLVMFFANTGSWLAFAPMLLEIINGVLGSPFLIASFFIFFILGFFTYAFLGAAIASTINRIEDVNTIGMIPVLFLMAGFFTAIFGGMANIDALAVKVISYIPLFTPMVMFTRQCMNAADWWEVLLSMVLTAGGVFVTGLLAAKIYRVGVMLYGKVVTPKEIWGMLTKS